MKLYYYTIMYRRIVRVYGIVKRDLLTFDIPCCVVRRGRFDSNNRI